MQFTREYKIKNTLGALPGQKSRAFHGRGGWVVVASDKNSKPNSSRNRLELYAIHCKAERGRRAGAYL